MDGWMSLDGIIWSISSRETERPSNKLRKHDVYDT